MRHPDSGMDQQGSLAFEQQRHRSRPHARKPLLCVASPACALVLTVAALIFTHAAPARAVLAADGLSPIGICYGRVSHAPMPPMPVVSMLQSNPQIARVKLFNADPVALTALANLGPAVEVMVMVPNQQLQSIAVDDAAADGWVFDNLLTTLPTGVNIRYVSVGNEPYLGAFKPSDDYLMLAVNRMQGALERAGLSPRVKLTVSFNSEILGVSYPASKGSFIPKWIDQIRNITSVINRTDSFFSVNIYPFFTHKSDTTNSIPLNYIMFGKDATPQKDGNLVYTNILDASYDAVLAALAGIGFPNLEVRIGEIGWPTDGDPAATLALSRQFIQGAVAHLTSGVGTPRRPNTLIIFYLFGLLDEDAKGVAPGPFERRWGMYDQLGQAKSGVDLSGGASPTASLPAIPGLQSLPKRWCVVSQDLASSQSSPDTQVTLQTLLANICGGDPTQSFDYSDAGDCTPLTATLSSPGLQCAAASKSAPYPLVFNVSYALNSKFQARGQDFNSCTFGGYGQITYTDPSVSQCTFPIGLDIPAIEAYYQPSTTWSWEVLGYIVALIAVLSTFL